MSETFRCDDKEMLVAYLYGEIDADDRRDVERHLRTCAACARETEGLQAVRRDLESWLPPESDLGFTIVQKPATVLRSNRWSLPAALPAWAQAAAAVLVIAAGAAIANVQVRQDHEGLTISTGWMRTESPTPAARAVSAPAADWQPAMAALERELRAELAEMRRASASADAGSVQAAAPMPVDTAAILRRVQAMLEESEQRQRTELAVRLTQARREVDMTRQSDLLRIGRGFGTLQDRAVKTEAGQQELMNFVRRVSLQPNQ